MVLLRSEIYRCPFLNHSVKGCLFPDSIAAPTSDLDLKSWCGAPGVQVSCCIRQGCWSKGSLVGSCSTSPLQEPNGTEIVCEFCVSKMVALMVCQLVCHVKEFVHGDRMSSIERGLQGPVSVLGELLRNALWIYIACCIVVIWKA